LAHAGAIALENARSYQQAEQAAALAERERILAEIHDGLAQTLSFMDLRLDTIQDLIKDRELLEVPEHLALTRRTLKQAEDEVRRLMSGLHAIGDTRPTFEQRLSQAVEAFAGEHEIEIQIQVAPGEPLQEPAEVYEQVVRVALEALTNVCKHTGAKRARFSLAREDLYGVLRIEDQGPGFDVRSPARGHFGLKVMKARAERIGGQLSVASAPGQGTTVTLRWPIAPSGG
jgi:signal transduction histidine kinase